MNTVSYTEQRLPQIIRSHKKHLGDTKFSFRSNTYQYDARSCCGILGNDPLQAVRAQDPHPVSFLKAKG